MFKFVIVEDCDKFQNIVSEIIDKVLFKTNIEYIVEKYSKHCMELQNTINDLSIQKVFILDIELGSGLSGLEIAKEIRKNDWDSEIIFITSHNDMFSSVYRNVYKVFNFIEKFVQLEMKLTNDLEAIISRKCDYDKYCFSNNKINMQIYYKDITYIYRDTTERKLVIKTTNNKFLINKPISEILTELDYRFQQTHRSCIVNKDRVRIFNWSKGYFVLDSGEKVDLCSKMYKGNIDE